MGGHNDGDQASLFVARGLARRLPAFGPEKVGESLRAVNAELYGHVREHPELAGMGSTVVGIAIHDKTVSVFSVGDSRCYRVEGKGLKQLSRDDSTQPNWKFGQPRSTLLLQCFGGRESFTDIEPFVQREPLAPGSTYLICCDGLYETLPEETMASLIGPDLQASCEALFKEAMAQKARDNVTIALVRIADK
jgi:serine/threonine protein phosphatase PrpC